MCLKFSFNRYNNAVKAAVASAFSATLLHLAVSSGGSLAVELLEFLGDCIKKQFRHI